MDRVPRLPLLLQLLFIGVVVGEVATAGDPTQGTVKNEPAEEGIKARHDAGGPVQPHVPKSHMTARAAHLQRRRLEVEHAEADEVRRERLKSRTDADARMRPLIQAQRKAERAHAKEVEEAKKAVEVSMSRRAEESEIANSEEHAAEQRAQRRREARRRVLRARWQEVLAAKRRAEEEASMPEEQRTARKAKVEAEKERVRRLEEAKEQKEERQRNYRKVQHLRMVAESKAKQNEAEKERRLKEFNALQKALEEKRKARANQPTVERTEAESVKVIPEDATAVLVRDAAGNEFPVTLPNKGRFQVIFGSVSHRLGLEPSRLRLTHNGMELSASDTLLSHKLEDGDIIEVVEV